VAAAWDITDAMLTVQLQQFRAWLLAEVDWVLHIYQNDYTPIPGSAIEDYTECDFPGYSAADLINADWGSVSVEDHVAMMTNDTPCEFEADPTGFVSQPAFGYYVTDSEGDYQYGERFALTKTIEPGGTLQVIAKLRQKTAPAT
jgi:hypothetical protein